MSVVRLPRRPPELGWYSERMEFFRLQHGRCIYGYLALAMYPAPEMMGTVELHLRVLKPLAAMHGLPGDFKWLRRHARRVGATRIVGFHNCGVSSPCFWRFAEWFGFERGVLPLDDGAPCEAAVYQV